MKKFINLFKYFLNPLNLNHYHYLNLYLYLYLYLLIVFALTQPACSPSLINLDTAKDRVATYYESGEYEKELTAIIDDAKKKFAKLEVQDNSVVVFDLDETALDNYEAIKKIGFGYEPKYWDDWVQQGAAPANKKVKELYEFLLRKGFKIIFLSGKTDTQYDATFRNLINVGYERFDTLIVRSQKDYKTKAAQFKAEKRKELTDKGYNIVGCVGDQESDCAGENSGIIVKLPNYLYLVE